MTSANVDALRDTASEVVDRLQRAATPITKQGKRQAGVLMDQSGELIDTVSERANETVADISRSIIAYTKKNPLTALLLAVGAGALLVGAAKSMQSRR